eukprot:7465113-Pyramimonas_sp.AAC.1
MPSCGAEAWRWIYSEQLRSVPWYSVYGNHDYRSDPCACADVEAECAQVNYDEQNLEYFQMPGTSYFRAFPDIPEEENDSDTDFRRSARSSWIGDGSSWRAPRAREGVQRRSTKSAHA